MVAKHCDGSVCTVKLHYDNQYSKFDNIVM
nr:DnaB-like helicase C-terminal domain-containing protein [Orientia tsutsugamushi]